MCPFIAILMGFIAVLCASLASLFLYAYQSAEADIRRLQDEIVNNTQEHP